jgi:hypothetical protein
MAVMMVEVPEGRTVHVIVGDVHPAIVPATAPIVDEHVVPTRKRRPLLMTTAGLCILAVGFVLGHRTIASHAEAEQPVASASIPASSPQAGLADSEAAAGNGTAAGPDGAEASIGNQVPPAFSQQLKVQPQVTPAPGASAAGGAAAKNPFGLGG